MGRDKALLELGGEVLIRRAARALEPIFERVIVVSNSQDVAQAALLARIPDARSDKGPLAGIEAALLHFQAAVFIVACDMPYLNARFIEFECGCWREELDALVPQSPHGAEPLHAIWSPGCLPAIQKALEAPRPPSLRRVLSELWVETISSEEARRFDPALRLFENWNSPEDVSGA